MDLFSLEKIITTRQKLCSRPIKKDKMPNQNLKEGYFLFFFFEMVHIYYFNIFTAIAPKRMIVLFFFVFFSSVVPLKHFMNKKKMYMGIFRFLLFYTLFYFLHLGFFLSDYISIHVRMCKRAVGNIFCFFDLLTQFGKSRICEWRCGRVLNFIIGIFWGNERLA